MPDVLLDDAWLFAAVGPDRIRRVPQAVAVFRPPTRWRDLWRQRVRAEGGKRELRRLGLPLAVAEGGLSMARVARKYPWREWPDVVALAAVKAAASAWSRVRGPGWRPATTTKG